MRHKESIEIQATPDVVWECIGSPEVWSSFHCKARDTKLVSQQGGMVGSRYEMQLTAGRKSAPSTGEITEIQTGRLISLKSTMKPKPGQEYSAMMTYELEDLGSRTKVHERIDVDIRHVNIFLRAVIWWINRFGSPREETTLMKLKRIIEQDT